MRTSGQQWTKMRDGRDTVSRLTRCEIAQVQVYLCADTFHCLDSRVPRCRERLALESGQGRDDNVVCDADANYDRHDRLGPDVGCEYPDDQPRDGDLRHRDGEQGGPHGHEVVEPSADPLLDGECIHMLSHAAVDGEDRQDAAGPQEYLGQTSAIILRVETCLRRQAWMWGLLKIGKRYIAY